MGSSDEPGVPASQTYEEGNLIDRGVIVHYDPESDKWEHFPYDDVGFFALGKYCVHPEIRLVLEDTDGWLWVTHTMPLPPDRKFIKLDAPVQRITCPGGWEFSNSSQLIVSTGLSWEWGSLWLIESSVFPEKLVQNAYGEISSFAALYNGIVHGTSWDLSGWDYDVSRV